MIAGSMSRVVGFDSQRLSMVSPTGSTLVIGLIVSTSEEPDVQILQQDDGDVEEDEGEEDTMDAGLGGD